MINTKNLSQDKIRKLAIAYKLLKDHCLANDLMVEYNSYLNRYTELTAQLEVSDGL